MSVVPSRLAKNYKDFHLVLILITYIYTLKHKSFSNGELSLYLMKEKNTVLLMSLCQIICLQTALLSWMSQPDPAALQIVHVRWRGLV